MTAPRLRALDDTERQTLRMCIRTLEVRAQESQSVTVSAPFAKVVARLLRRLDDSPPRG